jgi:hypothetical protein
VPEQNLLLLLIKLEQGVFMMLTLIGYQTIISVLRALSGLASLEVLQGQLKLMTGATWTNACHLNFHNVKAAFSKRAMLGTVKSWE